jgi:hypothetical protein
MRQVRDRIQVPNLWGISYGQNPSQRPVGSYSHGCGGAKRECLVVSRLRPLTLGKLILRAVATPKRAQIETVHRNPLEMAFRCYMTLKVAPVI